MADEKMDEEREMCQNCKKDIPVTNYRMHTLHCARNMVKCPDCDVMVGKGDTEIHRVEFHSLRVCDQCQVSIEAFKLPEHKKTLCSKRKLICKFCSQAKMAMEMSDHETYCGSRTERCDRCPDWVPLREWDSHQSRYHSNVQRRFRERSVIAQTETIVDYNAGKNAENDRNAHNTEPMLPCEFCDGLVPMRKLLEHQAACVNPTNVRRNDSSCNSSSSSRASRPTTRQLSCAEKMALESPIPSPAMSPKKGLNSSRKISAPPTLQTEEPEVNRTKVPCEFCNEPCSIEALMRHQRTCKKNPHISPNDIMDSSYGSGTSTSYTRQRHYSLTRTQSVRESSEIERPLRALSRQNSFSDRSYLRRSESFYGRSALTTMTLGRSAYSTGIDYASAVRRSSLFDGYAGYSIYSSISQGLDEITYGGRRSRRGSVTADYNNFTSRRGSTSTSADYAALVAATAAVEAANNSAKEKQQQQNSAVTETESGIGNSPKSINLSRNNSTRMSNMSDSAYGEDYESSSPIQKAPHKIQKSSSLRVSSAVTAPPSKPADAPAIKHSKSSGKLERKVSFSEADPVKINESLPAKPKRLKERRSKNPAAASASASAGADPAEFVDAVSAKLRLLEQQQNMDISATVKLSPKASRPQITSIVHDLVGPAAEQVKRENKSSRIASKRNSLDKQSVQTLAQDLAAECAKAYALMESSLSKLSTDLGVTPFGMAPKSKKLRKSSSSTATATATTTTN